MTSDPSRVIAAPAPGRSCGSCTLCCKVMAIKPLDKPSGQWCRHCKVGVGCTIYDDRPNECRTFLCMWLIDDRLGPEWKPERSKLVITSGGQGLEIRCDPGSPNAWKREPYHAQIVAWAHHARSLDETVTVYVGSHVTVIAPEGEFPLGKVDDDDRIVSHISGNRLMDVKVVKAGEA